MSFQGKIKGTLYWCHLRHVHAQSKKYQVTLGNLDNETVAALKSAGANVLKRDNEGYCVIFKSAFVPNVVDAKGHSIPDDIVRSIGNGSKGILNVVVKDSKFKNKVQGLNGVQVTEYVEFKSNGGFAPTEGYTAPEATDSNGEKSPWEDQVDE